jgi:hypothetical protein
MLRNLTRSSEDALSDFLFLSFSSLLDTHDSRMYSTVLKSNFVQQKAYHAVGRKVKGDFSES